MKNMTTQQELLCHTIIHSASASAGAVGFGLAQLPLADNAVIGPIQVLMTIGIGQVFGLELTKHIAAGMAASTVGKLLGRTASQVAAGWIPGAGNIMNAGTALSLTEAMGWMLAAEFASKSKSFCAVKERG